MCLMEFNSREALYIHNIVPHFKLSYTINMRREGSVVEALLTTVRMSQKVTSYFILRALLILKWKPLYMYHCERPGSGLITSQECERAIKSSVSIHSQPWKIPCKASPIILSIFTNSWPIDFIVSIFYKLEILEFNCSTLFILW